MSGDEFCEDLSVPLYPGRIYRATGQYESAGWGAISLTIYHNGRFYTMSATWIMCQLTPQSAEANEFRDRVERLWNKCGGGPFFNPDSPGDHWGAIET